MPATAAPEAAPPPPPRRRVYATVDPRCEWASTENDDTLVVDVSGFRKEELRVLYSTNRKLKVTGECQVDSGQWARFVKVFLVPKSCDTGAIRARMNIDNARLSVVLPKRSPSSSTNDKQNKPQSMGEHKGQENAGGSSGSSSGSLYSAQEDAGKDKVEEKEHREDQGMKKQRPEEIPVQDVPKRSDGDANAVEKDDADDKGESKRWWRKITIVHVLGFVLILALVGVGATLLYVMLL
ncbi:hypothetical protein PR202_ga12883 [Eleusine coracana subsp. coracana]|uniref:SHSP domain-containing protein n=1 Tax=Eleusine coracana subsp. coracana TaxID=191504 RepID=A0AAV5CDC8_ELECO|nr:hypothetical protein QOZ80_3AG0223160 [Eleusine coracana subsp. coracana]GJM96076.1 hypothetical protein PR202_ga12883 [Eleusine coracana subsp. coracana]